MNLGQEFLVLFPFFPFVSLGFLIVCFQSRMMHGPLHGPLLGNGITMAFRGFWICTMIGGFDIFNMQNFSESHLILFEREKKKTPKKIAI